MDTWKYSIPTWYTRECTPFLGNGYFAGSVPLDGHGVAGNPYACQVALHYVGENEDMASVPHWLNVPLFLNGQRVDPIFVHYHQELDLKRGVIETTYTDRSKSIRVNTRTFCHRGEKQIAAYRMTVTALKDAELRLEPQLNLSACWPKPTGKIALDQPGIGWTLDYGDKENKAAQLMALECSSNVRREAIHSAELVGQRISVSLKAGQSFTLRGTVATSAGAEPLNQLGKILTQASGMSFEALENSHARELKKQIWNGFDVEAEDPFLERRMRSAMFYLTCGYRHDVAFGGTATGLSHAGWGGSVFWDTEFYMFPPMLLFHPELARNMLLYRHATLDEARKNAAAHGEKGARFAWQSKKTGRPFAGDFENERHVTTNVAYSTWWYGQSTGDEKFMAGAGQDLILEVARNVASRAKFNAAKNRFELHHVIPPDEHTWDHYVGAPVNNSAMTNAYAQWALRAGAKLARGKVDEKEIQNWLRIADKMYLPRDRKHNIYSQYDGYNGHPIKQADVAHMFFPLCVTDDPAEIKRNVYYYADRERETSLYLTHSPFVYGAAAARAGDVAGVRRFFELSALNRLGPYELPRESNWNSGAPCVTGSGSFLALMLYGLLGIDNFGEKLTAKPCIPESVGKLAVSGVYFRGKRYEVKGAPGKKKASIKRLG